jgi:hypothetical protein
MAELISINDLNESLIIGEWSGSYFCIGNMGEMWVKKPITFIFKNDKTGYADSRDLNTDFSLILREFRWDIFNSSLIFIMGSNSYSSPSLVPSFKMTDNKMSFFFEKPIYLEKKV